MTIRMTPYEEGRGGTQEQANVQAAEAGLTATTQQAPPTPPPTPSAPSSSGMVSAATTTPPYDGSLDGLSLRQPQQGMNQLMDQRDSQVVEVLARSPHPHLRDLAARLRGL